MKFKLWVVLTLLFYMLSQRLVLKYKLFKIKPKLDGYRNLKVFGLRFKSSFHKKSKRNSKNARIEFIPLDDILQLDQIEFEEEPQYQLHI